MKTYEYRVAYRYTNGEVEGFVGHGGTKKAAEADALAQIRRKLDRIPGAKFIKASLVTSPSTLYPAELATVQADWRTNVRY